MNPKDATEGILYYICFMVIIYTDANVAKKDK